MQNILKGKYGVHSHSSIIGRQKTVNVYSCFLKLVIIRVARSSIKCLLCQALLFRVSPIKGKTVNCNDMRKSIEWDCVERQNTYWHLTEDPTPEWKISPPDANNPDSKVHGANMGPIWGRQDPGGPHVGYLGTLLSGKWLVVSSGSFLFHTVLLKKNALQWRHNGRDVVSNHRHPDCLLSRMFRCTPKKNKSAQGRWLWSSLVCKSMCTRRKCWRLSLITLNLTFSKRVTVV